VQILQRWAELTTRALGPEQQLLAIRAVSVCFLRMGKPSPDEARNVQRLVHSLYPSTDARVNQSLCELLVYVGSTNVVGKTMPLLVGATTQEEKFHYLFTLRTVTNGWSLTDRETYFSWLARARREFNGANMLPTALNYIRADAESTLTADERTRLAPALALLAQPVTADLPPPVARAFVREWSMQDLVPDLGRVGQSRNAARGKRLFAETGCLQCHRFGNEGGFIGPDLTAVSSRFDRRALLESIIEPSRVVSETYRSATVTLKSGAIHDGRIVSEDPVSLVLAINPVDPDQRRRLAKADIVTRRVSDLSPMPAGLLNTLNRDEILDLLAWMESGGTAKQPNPTARAQE
jgi:putative heme-binding domain-containing protein